jgi:hypothetical protein
MQALAERGMMALPRGKQRLRFLRRMRLDPPFLGAGHKEPGMECFQPGLRPGVRRPWLRPLADSCLGFFFVSDGRHVAFPG